MHNRFLQLPIFAVALFTSLGSSHFAFNGDRQEPNTAVRGIPSGTFRQRICYTLPLKLSLSRRIRSRFASSLLLELGLFMLRILPCILCAAASAITFLPYAPGASGRMSRARLEILVQHCGFSFSDGNRQIWLPFSRIHVPRRDRPGSWVYREIVLIISDVKARSTVFTCISSDL